MIFLSFYFKQEKIFPFLLNLYLPLRPFINGPTIPPPLTRISYNQAHMFAKLIGISCLKVTHKRPLTVVFGTLFSAPNSLNLSSSNIMDPDLWLHTFPLEFPTSRPS